MKRHKIKKKQIRVFVAVYIKIKGFA